MSTVLFVEDDPTIRNMYAFALVHEGFAVTLADSGVAALEEATSHKFDVMILDMMMMGGSGLDFLRTYNVPKRAPQTLIVALTNMDSPEVEKRARDLGVAHYWVKANVEPPTLATNLKKLLEEREGG